MFLLSEALEQVAQKGNRCPNSGGARGQGGWDPVQSDVVVGNPARGRRVRTRTPLQVDCETSRKVFWRSSEMNKQGNS